MYHHGKFSCPIPVFFLYSEQVCKIGHPISYAKTQFGVMYIDRFHLGLNYSLQVLHMSTLTLLRRIYEQIT